MNVYVVVVKGDDANEDDDRGKPFAKNISSRKGSNNPIHTFITPNVPQFHSVDANENVLQSLIHYVDFKNFKYVGEDDVGAHDNTKHQQQVQLNEACKVGETENQEEVPFLNDVNLVAYEDPI